MLTSCDSRLDARNAKKSYVHVRWAWPCTKNKTLFRYANEKDNLCVDILQFPSPHLITQLVLSCTRGGEGKKTGGLEAEASARKGPSKVYVSGCLSMCVTVYFSGSLCVWLSVDSKTLSVHVAGCVSLCL